MAESNKTTQAQKCAGVYADRSWGESWKREGFNGCLTTAIYALRYLSENPLPCGGADSYNSEHLYDTAGYISGVREDLIAFYTAGQTYPAEALSWPTEWLTAGYNCCLPAVVAALRYLADHPRAREGEQFTQTHLTRLADELDVTHRTLFDVPVVSSETTTRSFKRISASNLPEEFTIKDPDEYQRNFEKEFPGVAAIGQLISESANSLPPSTPGNPPAKVLANAPQALSTFMGRFSSQYGREPTAQEIFEAGMRAGILEVSTTSHQLERLTTARKLGTAGSIEYNEAIENAANEARKSGVAEAASDIMQLLLPREV